MKTSTALLTVMVTVSLVFSVAAFVIVANNNGIFAPNNPVAGTPTPTPNTPTPAPTQTSTAPPATNNSALGISYVETSREMNGDTAKITLNVTATYRSGDQFTIDYSQFSLQLYVSRMTVLLDYGNATYPNTGTLTLGPPYSTETFQLTFEYNTVGFNGMDAARVYYQLACDSSATIIWTNQDYHM